MRNMKFTKNQIVFNFFLGVAYMRNMVIYRLPVWLPAVLHSQSPLSRYGLMQRFQFSCRQCIATSNAVTMSARSHDDSFAE